MAGWAENFPNTNWGPNTYRYNISENDHIGMGFSNTGAPSPVVYAYNNTIYHSNSAPHGSTGIAFMLAGGVGASYGGGPSVASGSLFENNILIEASGNALTGCNGTTLAWMLFKNNEYYAPGGSLQLSAPGTGHFYCKDTSGNYAGPLPNTLSAWQAYANGGDTNAQNVNPEFSGTMPVGTCSWTPSLQSGGLACPSPYRLFQQQLAADWKRSQHIGRGSADYFGNSIPNGVGSGVNIGADGGSP